VKSHILYIYEGIVALRESTVKGWRYLRHRIRGGIDLELCNVRFRVCSRATVSFSICNTWRELAHRCYVVAVAELTPADRPASGKARLRPDTTLGTMTSASSFESSLGCISSCFLCSFFPKRLLLLMLMLMLILETGGIVMRLGIQPNVCIQPNVFHGALGSAINSAITSTILLLTGCVCPVVLGPLISCLGGMMKLAIRTPSINSSPQHASCQLCPVLDCC